MTAQPEVLHTELVTVKRPSFMRQLLQNRSGLVGLIIVTLFVSTSLLGAAGVTPYPPREQHAIDRLKAPSETYLMGTDMFGRDLISRLMKGGANSLKVALASVALSTFFGTLLGITAGFLGGHADNVIMRTMDVFFAFPTLLLALLVVVVLGPGLDNTILAIAIVYTPIFARVARGPVLSLKEMEYVTAARCLGISEWRILFRHVLPNADAPHRPDQPCAVMVTHYRGRTELPGAGHTAARTFMGHDA